jgi:endo-1,4-beta-xylanase
MKTLIIKNTLAILRSTLCFMILLSCQITTAQELCIDKSSDQILGKKDRYNYELWNQYSQGKACITIKEGALFSGEWSGIENYLARRGLTYNQTREHQEIGEFKINYNCDYNPKSTKGGNSYLSVYGWTVQPLVEYYIIEDWRNWIPSMGNEAILKGSFSVNGSMYDVYEKTRVNKPSIEGITTFQQYFSIRRDNRSQGTINISEHFDKWKELGMEMGKMHEVSFVVEGYKSEGSFEFKELNITKE